MNRPILLVALLVTMVCYADPLSAEEIGPSGASLSLFHTLPGDPPPEEITRNSHYWISNEMRLDLFHDSIRDRGGVYIGVGTDQNYLLSGWAKSEVLVLMDFDQKIVDLHRVYRLVFRHATRKEDFVALWQESARERLRDLIKQAYSTRKTQRPLLQAHRSAQRLVARRLKKLIKHMETAAVATSSVVRSEGIISRWPAAPDQRWQRSEIRSDGMGGSLGSDGADKWWSRGMHPSTTSRRGRS